MWQCRYICTICARVFCRRALLRRHHAVHSGYKEFTCNLCDYATSHKSNLERHMKIHESGEKYSSSSLSPSSTGQSGQHERSSPELDFFHPEDSNQSYRALPQSRDHNPILASLLSQPAHDGEVIQWIYHSPYDSYSSQVLNPIGTPLADGSSPIQHASRPERRWSSFNEESLYGSTADACGISLLESSQTVPRASSSSTTATTTTLPLRHAIDVILGVKEELPKNASFPPGLLYNSDGPVVRSGSCVVTTASNHWSVGHLSSPVLGQPDGESPANFSDSIDTSHSSHEPTCDVDSAFHQHYYHHHLAKDVCSAQKRPWQLATYNSSSLETRENATSTSTEEEDIAAYVPKKLRMSKRYQSN